VGAARAPAGDPDADERARGVDERATHAGERERAREKEREVRREKGEEAAGEGARLGRDAAENRRRAVAGGRRTACHPVVVEGDESADAEGDGVRDGEPRGAESEGGGDARDDGVVAPPGGDPGEGTEDEQSGAGGDDIATEEPRPGEEERVGGEEDGEQDRLGGVETVAEDEGHEREETAGDGDREAGDGVRLAEDAGREADGVVDERSAGDRAVRPRAGLGGTQRPVADARLVPVERARVEGDETGDQRERRDSRDGGDDPPVGSVSGHETRWRVVG
jgi:hypothetical protein